MGGLIWSLIVGEFGGERSLVFQVGLGLGICCWAVVMRVLLVGFGVVVLVTGRVRVKVWVPGWHSFAHAIQLALAVRVMDFCVRFLGGVMMKRRVVSRS